MEQNYLNSTDFINKIVQSHCMYALYELPTGIIDCCVTSPPYWNLRDYGVPPVDWPPIKYSILGFEVNIPEWTGQLGLEPDPQLFIGHLVHVFREVNRVLKKNGTLWLNIGDSYGRNGGDGSKYNFNGTKSYAKANQKVPNNIKLKDIIGIPWMLAFALRDDGWYLRQDIIWHKPNPTPESVTDRFTKAHEYLFLLSKSQKYYFDQEAIKEPASNNTHARRARVKNGHKSIPDSKKNGIRPPKAQGIKTGMIKANESFNLALKDMVDKRNKRSVLTIPEDNNLWQYLFENIPKHIIEPIYNKFINDQQTPSDVWNIKPEPLKEAHYASFPQKLIVDCIKAGCPKDGIVLDPFMGTGKTAIVAKKLGRNYYGIELDAKSIKISERLLYKELGLFL